MAAHSGTPDMRIYEDRLDSFFSMEPQQAGKKRHSAANKQPLLAWPHTAPTPEELAKAGFYYNPTTADNVECFHCTAKLDGWEDTDVPAEEHIAHSPDCAWAIAASASLPGHDADPTSKKMLEARIKTFGNAWPHEKKRGFKAKVKKLAEAGWASDVSRQGEDGTTCWYCSRSVDGWEKSDDPMEEHRRGAPDCAFFALSEQFATQRPKKQKARTSTASRTSRLSTQSVQSTFSEAPSLMSLGDADIPTDGDTSIGTVTSVATGAKKAKKTAAPKKTTARKKKGANADAEDTKLDATLTLPDAAAVQDEVMQDDTNVEYASMLKKEKPAKAVKGRGKAKKAAPKDVDMTDDHSQLQSELAASVVETEVKEAPKAKRGKKRASDGREKMEVAPVEAPPDSVEEASSKAKKTETVRTKKTKTVPDVPEEAQVVESDVNSAQAAPGEDGPRPKKARKTAKAPKQATRPPEPIVEPVIVEEEPAKEQMEDESSNFVEHPDNEDSSANFIVHEHTPSHEEFEPTPTPHKTLVARSPLPSARVLSAIASPQSARSHQSSDAENHPPASKTGMTGVKGKPDVAAAPVVAAIPAEQEQVPSPTKTTRIPLASQTPNKSPMRSPQKLGMLKTTTPWTATDLEMAFVLDAALADGPERAAATVAKKMSELGGQLSSPERKLTVEQWIRQQAAKGEEQLRDECERMVTLFEREGARALGALHGIGVRPA